MKNEKQQGNQPIAPLSNWAGVNPIGRGTTRDLRHQGMGHSEDSEMKTHEADHDYDETALNKTKESDREKEEEIKIEDENNDAEFEAFLKKELAYSASDEVRDHYMKMDPVHIKQTTEQAALETYYLNEMMDFMFDSPPIIHYPKPNSYRQRIKSTLGKRLQQLRITVEPKEEKEANGKSQAPAEIVLLLDRIGNNLPLSKWNKSRASASFARRLLILIRSHLRKKGLE